MQSNVPKVKLGEVLIHRGEFITVDDLQTYKRVTAQLHAKGIILRDEVDGALLKTKKQRVCKGGDFIVAEIDAKLGGFGIVPSDLEGSIVSSHYFLFEIDTTKLSREYLDFFIRTEEFQKQIIARGSTNYAAIRPPDVLQLEIPLPPINEQRRIVVTLELLMVKVEEARRQRANAVDKAEALVIANARHIVEKLKISPTPLNRWVDNTRDGIQTGPFGAQLGTSDFQDTGHPLITISNVQYGGLRLEGLRFVSEEKAKQLERYTVTKGDIIFARMGTVGRCCVVPEEAQDWLFNYHIIRVAPDQQRINPRYLHWIIQASPDIETYLEEKIRGATRQGVNTKIVSELPCRVPPLPEQRRIVTYLDRLQTKVDEVKRLQKETEREMEALVPAVLAKAFIGA